MKNKSVIAIIPARGGSSSIPNKNIINFYGKPLITWTIEQAVNSKYISDVYVSTDDKKISYISSKYGANVIERPGELATDFSPSEDALLHALSIIEKQRKISLVVFLQVTSPLRVAKDIDDAIEFFNHEKGDSLFSAAILGDFCVWAKKEEGLEMLERSAKLNPYLRQASYMLGIVYFEKGDMDKAMKQFVKYLALDPYNAAGHKAERVFKKGRGRI